MKVDSNILDDAIVNIANKKNIISEQALEAKKEYDLVKDSLENIEPEEDEEYLLTPQIKELTDVIKMLISIFSESKLDELVVLLANPGRVFTLNLFIGIFRGLGFAIGVTLIIFFTLYMLKDNLGEIISNFVLLFGV